MAGPAVPGGSAAESTDDPGPAGPPDAPPMPPGPSAPGPGCDLRPDELPKLGPHSVLSGHAFERRGGAVRPSRPRGR